MRENTTTDAGAARRYRYYGQLPSRHMMRCLDRHLPKIGRPLRARGMSHGKNGGWYQVLVTGTAGKLVLRGCSWGYGGEGPHATEAVLRRLGALPYAAHTAAFCAANQAVGTAEGYGRTFWDVNLATGRLTGLVAKGGAL